MKTCHMHTRHATDVHVALHNRIMICNAVLYNNTQISELKAKSFLKKNKIDIKS
jgi:hypothetical protein